MITNIQSDKTELFSISTDAFGALVEILQHFNAKVLMISKMKLNKIKKR